MSNGRLQDRIAIITGGSSGIGAATVELFLEEGALVISADIQDDKGAAQERRYGNRLRYSRCDVTREEDIARTVELAKSTFGGLDIMFNNAGVGGTPASPLEITTEGWDFTFAVLARGPAMGIRYAAPLMIERGGGSIINTASIAALTTGWGYAYSSAKAAVLHMTRYAAAELSPQGIRVNAICPGIIATPIFGASVGAPLTDAERNTAAVAEAAVNMQPLRTAGLPRDIAEAALFLASDASRFMTGAHMVIDGGFTLGDRTAWDPNAPSAIKDAMAKMAGL